MGATEAGSNPKKLKKKSLAFKAPPESFVIVPSKVTVPPLVTVSVTLKRSNEMPSAREAAGVASAHRHIPVNAITRMNFNFRVPIRTSAVPAFPYPGCFTHRSHSLCYPLLRKKTVQFDLVRKKAAPRKLHRRKHYIRKSLETMALKPSARA